MNAMNGTFGFTDSQKAELEKPLDRKHVKPPPQGKRGNYVEGWHVIAEANRIFGFDGWTRETVSMVETNRDLLTLKGDRGEYQQWRVGYLAKVRVMAAGVLREGTGFGTGMGKPEALGEVIESAAKEAETDAMKRALMTFGNPFGLALYDKSLANVADGEMSAAAGKPPSQPTTEAFDRATAAIAKSTTVDDLKSLWAKIETMPQEQISDAQLSELGTICTARVKELQAAAPKRQAPPFPGDLP